MNEMHSLHTEVGTQEFLFKKKKKFNMQGNEQALEIHTYEQKFLSNKMI